MAMLNREVPGLNDKEWANLCRFLTYFMSAAMCAGVFLVLYLLSRWVGLVR